MNRIIGIVVMLMVAAGLCWFFAARTAPVKNGNVTYISPRVTSINQTVTTTATITPRNRLEVRPPVAGRLEQMLVKEGQSVKAGDPVAVISSTDRATLIDAARGKGAEELKYWQEVYKPIQLVSPMDATVIVATLQPGQVVATIDAIVVLSDELIIQAQTDETDIGKIKVGQNATVVLDSYPSSPVDAVVEHIYYESTVSSNVTVYKVDLKLPAIPEFFRSGMNAQVTFVIAQKQEALVLPVGAVDLTKGKPQVTVLDNKGKPEVVEVTTGLISGDSVEIVAGLSSDDRVVVTDKKLNLNASASTGKNPFMPQFNRSKNSGSGAPPRM